MLKKFNPHLPLVVKTDSELSARLGLWPTTNRSVYAFSARLCASPCDIKVVVKQKDTGNSLSHF